MCASRLFVLALGALAACGSAPSDEGGTHDVRSASASAESVTPTVPAALDPTPDRVATGPRSAPPSGEQATALGAARRANADPAIDDLLAEAKDLSGRGLHAQALLLWERLAEADPGPRSSFNLGRARMLASRLDDAETSFLRVLEARPGHLRTWLNLGNLERRRGDLDAAIGWYRRILERDPDFLLAYFNLAEVLEVQGRAENALGVWVAALERAPRSPSDQRVYNDCVQRAAAGFLDRGETQRAVELAGKLAAAQPDHPGVHYTLGQAWLTLGDEAKARTAFERHAAIAASRTATSAAAGGDAP